MTRRLYLKLYLTFLGVTVLALACAGLAARVFQEVGGAPDRFLPPVARMLLGEGLPGRAELPQRLRALADELELDVVLWDTNGRVIAQATDRPFPPPRRFRAGWDRGQDGVRFLVPVGSGRFLGLRERGRLAHRRTLFLGGLGVVAVVMALGLYPLSRGITRRLEHLAEGARRWGAGELGHRVPVEGKDEIASVATRFNQAAAALETLVAQQRHMLANASHELRSPLARLRMALELCAEEPDPDRRRRMVERAHEDIVDLDALVEDVLLSARAQPGVPRRPFQPVALLALVQDEAKRASARASGEEVTLPGDAPMLRHLVRNLLTNARLHGGDSEVEASVATRGEQVVIAVEDRGPGIPEAEREKIFAPFYRPTGRRPVDDAGVGLGLALVRQVAAYHGGEARYVPREGGGSRFEVTLPLARA